MRQDQLKQNAPEADKLIIIMPQRKRKPPGWLVTSVRAAFSVCAAGKICGISPAVF